MYVLTDGDYKGVQGTALSIVKLDTWIATVGSGFFEERARGGKRQKHYVDLLAVDLPEVSNKTIGEVRDLAGQRDCWELAIYEDKENVDGDMRVRFF